jgi:hypothetical protein
MMIACKRFLGASLLTFLLVSCSTDKEETPINSLEDVLKNLAPTPRTFEINPSEEIMLKGDKGTSIFITKMEK